MISSGLSGSSGCDVEKRVSEGIMCVRKEDTDPGVFGSNTWYIYIGLSLSHSQLSPALSPALSNRASHACRQQIQAFFV